MDRRDPAFQTDQSIPSLLQLILLNYSELMRLVQIYNVLPEKKRVRGEREGFLKGIILSGFRWQIDLENLADTSTTRLRYKMVSESLTELLSTMIVAARDVRTTFRSAKNSHDAETFEDNLNRAVEWMNQLLLELTEDAQVVALAIFLLIRKGFLNQRKLSVPDEALERVFTTRSDTLHRVAEEVLEVMEDPFASLTHVVDCVLDRLEECQDRPMKVLILQNSIGIIQGMTNRTPDEDHLAFTIVQRFLPKEQTDNGIVSDQHPFMNLIPPQTDKPPESPE